MYTSLDTTHKASFYIYSFKQNDQKNSLFSKWNKKFQCVLSYSTAQQRLMYDAHLK